MPINEQALRGRLDKKLAQDLLKRGLRVQAKARRYVGGAEGHIKRVDSGDLRSSIQVQPRMRPRGPSVRVGTGKKYARFVHEGTGLYGPKKQLIKPKSKKVLAFKSKKYGGKRGVVFARSVKGMRRNQFLKDALPAAKG